MMGGGVVGVPLAFVCLMPLFSLAAVTINNNGYYGIEIAIHKEVPEDLQLLETLKVRQEIWKDPP